MNQPSVVKRRERDAIIQSLTSGVVPRIGLQHIQVGRKLEVQAVLRDLSRVTEGSAAFRLVIGPFGSGKTFFMHLMKILAQEQKLVVVHADLTPERRLSGTGGAARALYQELMRNLSTKTMPDGGALPSVVERWIANANLGDEPTVENVRSKLRGLEDLVSGFDFAAVIARYAMAYQRGDDAGVANALRWLRGEYVSKMEARKDLDVRSIIDDASVYDYVKLMSAFVRMAGYSGLLVVLDEAINLFKMRHPEARSRNYETILRILNDCLQGGANGLMVAIGGTPDFLRDRRRGLASYQALQSRLADNQFATEERRDLTGPVIELPNLTPEDLYVLLHNLRRIHAGENPEAHRLPDEGIQAFLDHCSQTLGDSFFRTPRDTVVQFVKLLNLLEQHPDLDWRQPLRQAVADAAAQTQASVAAATAPAGDDDVGLATFKL